MDNKQLKDVVVAFVRDMVKANAMGGQIVGRFNVTDLKKGTKNNRTEAYTKFYNAEKGAWNVTKVTEYKNVTFQRDYANSVTNRADNAERYVAEAPNGKSWVDGCEGILLVSNTDPTKFYLRVSENKNTKRTTTYYVGANKATESELAIIKAYSPKKEYVCQKQLAYGVAEEDVVTVKDITLNNIVSIKFGDKVLTLQ